MRYWGTGLLLGASRELAGIDYSPGENQSNLDPKIVERIEAIGRWYLSGSRQADELKFAIGARVLSLLKESPDSNYFKNLKDDQNHLELFAQVVHGNENKNSQRLFLLD